MSGQAGNTREQNAARAAEQRLRMFHNSRAPPMNLSGYPAGWGTPGSHGAPAGPRLGYANTARAFGAVPTARNLANDEERARAAMAMNVDGGRRRLRRAKSHRKRTNRRKSVRR